MSVAGDLDAVTAATWPAAAQVTLGAVTLRDGAGGGKRVSAATVLPGWSGGDLARAEAAMIDRGTTPLFRVGAEDAALDADLAARGYALIDPVNIWTAPVETLTHLPIPRLTAFAIWEPLAIMREIWAQGGIGAERVAVMERAQVARTGLFGRAGDRPAGAGYCGLHDGTAMVHALEILPAHRGKGLGAWMMRRAATWAQAQGAAQIAALCTQANGAANGLYAALGMQIAGQYHYRAKDAGS